MLYLFKGPKGLFFVRFFRGAGRLLLGSVLYTDGILCFKTGSMQFAAEMRDLNTASQMTGLIVIFKLIVIFIYKTGWPVQQQRCCPEGHYVYIKEVQ